VRPSLPRLQWCLLLREPAPRLGVLVLLLALGYALVRGAAWTAMDVRQMTAAEAEAAASLVVKRQEVEDIEAERVAAADRPYAGSPLDYHVTATLPQRPLAALAAGQRDLSPSIAEITLWGRSDTVLARQPLENPEHLQAGRFDVAFVVVYLLPLLVIGLGFDLLAGERERGTLRLVLAQPVTLVRYLLAKVAVRFALIVGATLAFAALALVGLGVSAAAPLLVWLLVVWLYAGFWLALTFAVNARARSTAANAMALASTWVALVLLLPAVINVVVEQLLPLPSRMELIGELRAAENAAKARAHDHPELTADDPFTWARGFYRVQRDIERQTAPTLAAFEARLAARRDVVHVASSLSPAVLVHDVLTDIAGSGVVRHADFAEQVQVFAADLHATLAPRLFTASRLHAAEYDTLPRFTFVEEGRGRLAARLAPPILLLLAVTAGLLMWGCRRLRRSDVLLGAME
jgi:ABC-2 type transport system permease protein